jgi:hypothetical protein
MLFSHIFTQFFHFSAIIRIYLHRFFIFTHFLVGDEFWLTQKSVWPNRNLCSSGPPHTDFCDPLPQWGLQSLMPWHGMTNDGCNDDVCQDRTTLVVRSAIAGSPVNENLVPWKFDAANAATAAPCRRPHLQHCRNPNKNHHSHHQHSNDAVTTKMPPNSAFKTKALRSQPTSCCGFAS